MFQQVVKILENFGYKVDYTSYHTDYDIKKYASLKDSVSGEKFFTVYSPEGYVIGRVHKLKKSGKFQLQHLKTIIGYFKMFEMPNRSSIIVELEKIFSLNKKNQ